MNILITAGGTEEPIDGVRKIINTATGRLGSLIADAFAEQADVDTIYYICGKTALLPKTSKAKVIRIGSTTQLEEAITQVLTQNRINAGIHSMAVSDYTVRAVTTAQHIAEAVEAKVPTLTAEKKDLSGLIEEVIQNITSTDSDGKIRSDINDLMLIMKRTPKIISLFKKLSPNTVLVGFKLLNGVPVAELMDFAYSLLVKNQCDYVLANDLTDINAEKHTGYLIDKDKSVQRFESKEEIADGITAHVMNKLRGIL